MARRKRSRRKSASPPRPQVEYNTRAVAQRTPEEQEEALRLKAEAERRKAIRKGPLRCLPLEADEQIQVLWWRSEIDPIPIAVERALVVELLPRKHKEMGMMREKSKQEINRIKEIGKEYGINMATLCSLRRHHIKNYHLHKTMPELGLGRIKDINESARIFECAIFTFLRANKIACFTEEEQRRRNPVTPDFLMKRPVLLRSFRYEECDAESSEPRKKIIVERQIHWIEAKMFYGASTIGPDGMSAVGNILKTAEKYTRLHGAGAMIFFQGYGDVLGEQLLEMGVVPLDCCTDENIKHKRVKKHQRTWCANERNEILP